MYSEVLTRIRAVLDIASTELLDTWTLILTVPPTVPRLIKGYDHFVAVIGYRPMTFTQSAKVSGQPNEREVPLTIPLDVFSAPVNTDYDVRMITNITTVGDVINDTFNQRPYLQNASNVPLDHMDTRVPVLLASGTVADVQPYPGQTTDWRYHYGAIIQLTYNWVCPVDRP